MVVSSIGARVGSIQCNYDVVICGVSVERGGTLRAFALNYVLIPPMGSYERENWRDTMNGD